MEALGAAVEAVSRAALRGALAPEVGLQVGCGDSMRAGCLVTGTCWPPGHMA